MDMEGACFNPRELELGDSSFFMELDAQSPGLESGSHLHFFSQDFEFGKPSPGSSVPPASFFDATPFSSLQPEGLYNGEPLEILPELSHSSEGDTESSPPDTIKVESPIDPALTEKPKSPKSPVCTRARPTRGSSRTTRPPAKLRADMETPIVPSEQSLSHPGKSGKVANGNAKIEKPSKEKPPARKRSKRAAAEPPKDVEPENGEEDTREKFLARNRVAASKCRQKKKAYVDTMQEDLRVLEEKYKSLKEQLQGLGEAGRIALDQQVRVQRDLEAMGQPQDALDAIYTTARSSYSEAAPADRDDSTSQPSPTVPGSTAAAFAATPPSVKRGGDDTNLNHMPDEMFKSLASSGSDQT